MIARNIERLDAYHENHGWLAPVTALVIILLSGLAGVAVVGMS